MTILIILLSAVILVHVVLLARDRALRPRQDDATVAPVEDFVSAPMPRRRPLRDSLVGLVDHAGNSWRMFKHERASKAASGEIVSPAQLVPKDPGRITLRSLPPPPRKT